MKAQETDTANYDLYDNPKFLDEMQIIKYVSVATTRQLSESKLSEVDSNNLKARNISNPQATVQKKIMMILIIALPNNGIFIKEHITNAMRTTTMSQLFDKAVSSGYQINAKMYPIA